MLNLIAMKKIFLIPISLLFICKFCYSQDSSLNRVASFKNYGQHIYFYLKPQHESIYKGELDTLKEQNFFLISFKIDIYGNVVEYETDKKYNIPEVVINYIKKIIYLTSGNWKPEISNCSIVQSEKILCEIALTPKSFFSDKLNGKKELKLEDLKVKDIPQLNLNDPNRCFLFLNY